MYRLIKRILFLMQPEKAHYFTASILRIGFAIPGVKALVRARFGVRDEKLKCTVFGIDFPNPVGLAAGFDKNGSMSRSLSNFGFGFIEIGTITPKGQPGNPKPRLFRLPEDDALINRMGFNNDGVDVVVERLKGRPKDLIVGGNIGKNKVTPNEQAIDDYLHSFNALFDYVDYFVVNVSSPNTPNLRDLQEKEPLTRLLSALMSASSQKAIKKPILLKIAPDLTEGQLDDIVDIVKDTGIAGLICANTTISRDGLKTAKVEVDAIGAGGLSGAPVRSRSTEVIQYVHKKSGGSFPIVGVGGIHSAQDAIEKLDAGASLVQVYTGFVYEGPGLVRSINRALANRP